MKHKLIAAFIVSLCFLPLSATADAPEYGQGHDVYTTSGAAELSGETLFITWPAGAGASERFLAAVDIGDAEHPRLLDKLPLDGFPQDLALDGTRAYVVNGRDLLVIDISDPSSLHIQDRLRIAEDPLYGPQGIALHEGHAWLACRLGGVKSVNISDSANYAVAGRIGLPAFTRGLAVAGDFLYAAGDTRGVFTINIADPAQPRLLDRLPAPAGTVGRIHVKDGLALLAAGNILIAALGLDSPDSPQWLGHTSCRHIMTPYYGSYGHDLTLVEAERPETGDATVFAVVADGEGGLIVTDISQPESPRFVGGIGGIDLDYCVITALTSANSFVYAVDELYGLRIVDVSSPDNPEQIGEGLELSF